MVGIGHIVQRMNFKTTSLLIYTALFCGGISITVSSSEARAQAMELRSNVGKLRPSFYWAVIEKPDGLPRDQDVLDMEGNVLAKVSAPFMKRLKMEGTGRLMDGRVVNFKDRVKKSDGTLEIRWRICGPEAPYGFGLGDIPLVPFRSVAVDPTVIPIGSKIFIPAAKGAVLPNGDVHDGVFTAVDIGDMIKDKKIDIFTSFGDQSKVFTDAGMETGRIVDVYLLK
jgi:3D (Asp-Asp-Asp) domain-containing protein